ncbi:MAG: DUF4224 domain-containing protein [Zoogloeaceae bacterium]|nr:DUF4224 domain-containing protein [Zoogloeaceae bacterium]
MTSPSLFLSPADIEVLTGRKSRAHQIKELRRQGIQFYTNAIGRPVVPVTAITGVKSASPEPVKWQPAMLGG